jgi:glycosyltransferase involved in cell wall biosynthesis
MDITRLKLGILFYFNSSWMGGVNYIINVVNILNFLDDEDKPEITIFFSKDHKKNVTEINYPYLSLVEWQFPSILKGYLKSWISGKNAFINDILSNYEFDGLYPLHDYPVRTISNTKIVAWYADLQHKYYPEFFTKLKILERTSRIKFILRNSNDLVVSSKAVADDFDKFFSFKEKLNIHIFHFASVIDNLTLVSIEELRIKYNLPSKYFMISNQFYKHKNHKVLLNAIAILNGKGVRLNLVFTGKLPDKAHSPYIRELYDVIINKNLKDQISFLGVISRNEQLVIMKHSQAVVQPTLFEGWSTVIEDAISLQVPVVASDLQVNIEQLGKNGVYFDPHNPSELASILINFPQRNMENVFYEEYSKRIKNSAEAFIKIFS